MYVYAYDTVHSSNIKKEDEYIFFRKKKGSSSKYRSQIPVSVPR